MRKKYKDEVLDYETKSIDNNEPKVKSIVKNVNESTEYIRKCRNYLIDNKNIDDNDVRDKNIEIETLKKQIQRKLISVKSTIFSGNLLNFEKSCSSKCDTIFGKLKLTPLIDYESKHR